MRSARSRAQHAAARQHAAAAAGDALATCSHDGTWRLWDVATGAALLEQEGHSRAVHCIGFHPDGSLCGSGGFDAASRVWDCRTGRNVLTFQGHTYGILSMAFSPNGYHVATGVSSLPAAPVPALPCVCDGVCCCVCSVRLCLCLHCFLHRVTDPACVVYPVCRFAVPVRRSQSHGTCNCVADA